MRILYSDNYFIKKQGIAIYKAGINVQIFSYRGRTSSFHGSLCEGTLKKSRDSGVLLCMFDNGASFLCVHNGPSPLTQASP
jgi:hypothetical protein